MRLGDLDALKETKYVYHDNGEVGERLYISFDEIDNAPTVDAVPVVRCKDCKWFRDSNGIDGFCYCDRIYRRCGTHWFCADGERKEDDDDDYRES